MKDVTLNNGTTMTDAEYIKKFGMGDAPTDFVATKDDLVSLALNVGRVPIARKDYILDRLERLVDYLPELYDLVTEELRHGREKNNADVK
jgi:hypothetical protein